MLHGVLKVFDVSLSRLIQQRGLAERHINFKEHIHIPLQALPRHMMRRHALIYYQDHSSNDI
jgi:hypothetical protein